jgi:hypothetical protein
MTILAFRHVNIPEDYARSTEMLEGIRERADYTIAEEMGALPHIVVTPALVRSIANVIRQGRPGPGINRDDWDE